MKHIKIYIAVMSVMLLLALGSGVYVWYTVQTVNRDLDNVYQALEEKTAESAPPLSETNSITPTEPVDAVSPTTTEENIEIDVNNLNPEQQAILKTFGFGGETIVITPTMVTCAEAAVGTTRFAEILNGNAPSPLESMRLLPCVKK